MRVSPPPPRPLERARSLHGASHLVLIRRLLNPFIRYILHSRIYSPLSVRCKLHRCWFAASCIPVCWMETVRRCGGWSVVRVVCIFVQMVCVDVVVDALGLLRMPY